jgi:hypothetical protein
MRARRRPPVPSHLASVSNHRGIRLARCHASRQEFRPVGLRPYGADEERCPAPCYRLCGADRAVLMRTRNKANVFPRTSAHGRNAALTMSHHGQASRRSLPSVRTSSRLKSVSKAPRYSFRCALCRIANGCSRGQFRAAFWWVLRPSVWRKCLVRRMQSANDNLRPVESENVTIRELRPAPTLATAGANSANTTAAIKANSRLTPSSRRSLAPEPFQIEEVSAKRPLIWQGSFAAQAGS